MVIAGILLGLAALIGVPMALIRFSGKPRPPTWVALIHGPIAAAGLGFLIYAAVTTGLPVLAQWALGLFVLAAIGGAVTFLGFHLRNKPLPIGLVVVHALAAVAGYVLLLMAITRGP